MYPNGCKRCSRSKHSARAGASRLASPRRMNQTETLRFRQAAAIVTADKQIGPGPSFSKRSRGARLVSGHTKACYEADRGGSLVGSSVLVEAARKPRLGRSLALPRRGKQVRRMRLLQTFSFSLGRIEKLFAL